MADKGNQLDLKSPEPPPAVLIGKEVICMKRYNAYRFISLLMAFMLVFSSSPVLTAASAQEAVASIKTGEDTDLTSVCDLKLNQVINTYYNFTSRDLLNPNKTYELTMEFEDKTDYPLPYDTDQNPMIYSLSGYSYVTVKNGANDDVSWEFDPDNDQLVFSWKNGRKSAFSAKIEYTLKNGLIGSTNLNGKTFVLARYSKTSGTVNTVSDRPAENNSMLEADRITIDDNGNYSPANVTKWTFVHVTDDWYMIYTGRGYMTIRSDGRNKNGELQVVPENEAIALRVSYTSGAVSISDGNGYYINDKGDGGKKRFQAYKKLDDGGLFYLLPQENASTVVTVEFDGNGLTGTMPDPIDGKIGTEVSLPTPDIPDGCDFAGWSTSTKADGLIKNPENYIISGDSPLYAIWAERISYTAHIIWDDNEDENEKRPDSVTIRLNANGEQLGDDVTIAEDADGKWEYTFTDLRAIDEDGYAIIYSIDEETPVGYFTEITGNIIKNTIHPKVTLKKKVAGEIWLVRCDVMDQTTFTNNSGEIWKTDVISNPKGILSNEGHRDTKCGNAENWVIWVGEDGVPFRMDEIKSGATGSTLPTVVYRTVNDLTDDQIQKMTANDTGLVTAFAQNFVERMNFSEVSVNKRLYWVTWNGKKVWHHSGIPYKAELKYVLYVDGKPYMLAANGEVTLDDLSPGYHTISEEPDPKCYLGEVTATGGAEITQPNNDWYVTIEIPVTSDDVNIEWPNEFKIPDIPPDDPPPPERTTSSVQKVWDDNDDQDGIRPDSLKVELFSDGQHVKTVTLYAKDNWKHTETGLLIKNKSGKNIVYSWSEYEDNVPAGYTFDPAKDVTVVNNSDEGVYTRLTNHHTPETTSVSVTKAWDDNDNQDGLRKPVTFTL